MFIVCLGFAGGSADLPAMVDLGSTPGLRPAGLQESCSTHVVPGSRGCLQGLWGHLRRTACVCLNGWR